MPPGGVPVSRAPWQYLAEKVLAGRDITPSTKSALASENLWVPVLAGVGSMLASKSPYLGGAIGEGLVGGTSAYTGLQKQQAETDKAVAEAGLTKAMTSRARIFADLQGRRLFLYADPRTGEERVMRLEDALDRIEKGEAFGLDPAERARIIETERTRTGAAPTVSGATEKSVGAPPPGKVEVRELPPPATGTVAPAEKKPAEVAPAEVPPPPVPAKTAKTPAEDPAILSQEDIQHAERYRKEARDQTPGWYSSYKDIYTPQQELAQGAQNFRTQFLPMASALAGAPKSGILATGPLQAVLNPLARVINNISDVVGLPEGMKPINAEQLANAEEARKYVQRLREAAVQKNNFTAVGALSAIERGYPSDANTARGLAKLLAGISVETQMDIDKNDYYQQFRQRAESGSRDTLAALKSGSWADLSNRFDRSRAPVYQEDKRMLERIYSDAIPVKGPDRKDMYLGQDNKLISRQDYAAGRGQPITVAEYMIKYGADIARDENKRKWVEQHYGPRAFRYFGIVR
jgi:hypothetical protein